MFKIIYRSTDFRLRYLDIVDLCSKILHKILKKCSFIYFVLLSHELRWATQTETDVLIKYNEHISISRAHI